MERFYGRERGLSVNSFGDIFCLRIPATSCNSRSGGGGSAAGAAVAADFQAGNNDVEAAIALDLSFEAIEEITFEFGDFSAAQAGHVDMVPLGATFVIMLLALQVHEVEFVNQAVAFQEIQRAVDGHAIDLRIERRA